MPRPPKPDRTEFTLRIPVPLGEEIEAVRGKKNRNDFIEDAIRAHVTLASAPEAAVRPLRVVPKPPSPTQQAGIDAEDATIRGLLADLGDLTCEHEDMEPVGGILDLGNRRIQVHQCQDCGAEVEESV